MRSRIGAVSVIAALVAWHTARAQPDTATVADSVVQVVVMNAGEVRRLGSGFAVTADGHIVTAAHLVADQGTFAVVPLTTRVELVARVAYLDERADVAVLAVNGLELPPLEVAMDGFDPGRRVFSGGVWSQSAESLAVAEAESAVPVALTEGAVGAHSTLTLRDGSEPVELVEHNAMIPAAGYGGPLLNECGQLTAVNRATPGVTPGRLRQGQPPEGVVYAARLTAVLQWLESQGVEVGRSDTACSDALSAAQTQAEQTAELLEQSQQALQQAAIEADEARLALEQAADAANAAEARVGELETQYEQAVRAGDEQAETLRAELDTAREQQVQAQSVLVTMEEELAALEARLGAQTSANRTRLIAGASAAGLMLLAGFVLYRRRSRELAVVREQAEHVRREASAAVAAAREPKAGFADCRISGETAKGVPVSIKIPGALFETDSVVLGRSPRNSTFLIDDPTISREHARLFCDGGRLFVEDLGTTNGTRVNGQRIEPQSPAPIAHGDVIELGEVRLSLGLEA